MCQPDKRNLDLGISLETLKDLLSQVQVSQKVPAKFKGTLEFAKQICLYGYFEYDFYTLGLIYVFLLVETAIKERFLNDLPDKCHLIRGKESQLVNKNYEIVYQRLWEGWMIVGFEEVNSSLWSILKWLKKNQILPERIGKKEIELLRQIRSDANHLPVTDFHTPTLVIPVVWKIIDFVNCLFDPAVHDKEPKILKQQKESHKQMSQWLERVIRQLQSKDKETT